MPWRVAQFLGRTIRKIGAEGIADGYPGFHHHTLFDEFALPEEVIRRHHHSSQSSWEISAGRVSGFLVLLRTPAMRTNLFAIFSDGFLFGVRCRWKASGHSQRKVTARHGTPERYQRRLAVT
jgi:hypothetical protein